MSSANVLAFQFYPDTRDIHIGLRVNMPTCISVDRYGRLCGIVATEPWIDTVNRLLRAKQRPDPKNRTALKWWTQGDLADTAGVRGNTLSDMMNSKREPGVDTLRKIAQALDVPAFFMMMTEAEQQTYLSASANVARESADEAAKREARDYYISKIDGLFDQWGAERTAPPVSTPTAVEQHHIVRKTRRRA